MPNLVEPIKRTSDNPLPIADALRDIQEAHDYLVRRSMAVSYEINNVDKWGYHMKRLAVSFPENERPKLVSKNSENYVELINQCATMEHLINALLWAMEKLPDYAVLGCHPTTSSGSSDDTPDNDIFLINPQNQYALFEVFDNINPNQPKKSKSIGSLKREANKLSHPPRLFIVCGIELWKRKIPWQQNHTYIFEITES